MKFLNKKFSFYYLGEKGKYIPIIPTYNIIFKENEEIHSKNKRQTNGNHIIKFERFLWQILLKKKKENAIKPKLCLRKNSF